MHGRNPSLGVALALFAGPAVAHHSLAAYDHARSLELDATVAEFHYTQPHPFLVLQAPEPGGKPGPLAWRAELDNLWELDAIGISAATFKPGDKVQVSGQPMRDGTRALYVRRLDRPRDGLRYEQVGFQPRLSVRGR